jgi:hypothetical protein
MRDAKLSFFFLCDEIHGLVLLCRICEVCGSIAGNVVGSVEVESEESRNEANGVENLTLRTSGPRLVEGRSFWQGHRFLNFLLACMVFAFVISWLFHFNVPST